VKESLAFDRVFTLSSTDLHACRKLIGFRQKEGKEGT